MFLSTTPKHGTLPSMSLVTASPDPRRRPGALRYAVRRLRNIVRPPVTVVPAPPGLTKDADVPVVMRDGVVLRANVYRPAGPGPFPVILSVHPYGKDVLPRRTRRGYSVSFQFRVMNQPEPFEISSETGWEAPDPVRWTAAGYAVINVDERGAGHSDGVGSMLTDAEAADVYDVIEWAGAQSWSTGRVGMLGVSYLAMSQYKAAALHPPHLAAICPWEGFTDIYRDFMRGGGIEEDGFSRIWTTMTRRVTRMSDDIGAERRRHPLRDEWWRSLVPDLTEIQVPMLACASFSDANLHSTGSMRAFELAGSADKHVYTHRGPKWSTFYGEGVFAVQQAFFDKHLKQRTGVELPPVRLEVRESRREVVEVREERDWPLARTQWTPVHLGAGGTLSVALGEHGSVLVGAGRRSAAFELRFDRDTEVTGPTSATLWLSVPDGGDATVFAAVEKWSSGRWVPSEGSYGFGRDRVAIGRQRVSLRWLDDKASTIGRPVHTFDRVDLVEPGEVVTVDVALTNSATVYRAGDVLRLVLSSGNLDPINVLFGHFPARYRADKRTGFVVHMSADRPSHLLLPVVPGSTTTA